MFRILLKNKMFLIFVATNIVYLLLLFQEEVVYCVGQIKRKAIYTIVSVLKPEFSNKHKYINNEPLGIYFYMDNAFIIRHTQINKQTQTHSDELYLDTNLIIPPGYYMWSGKVFDMSKEGLYYLADFERKISRYFIVYNQDIFALLSSISWLVSHGSQDDGKTFDYLIEKLKTKKLSLTCGDVSVFTSELLDRYGIENRVVTFLTMDKWNSYDNGHTVLEVKIDGKFVLVDLDNNRILQLNGHMLSVKDFLEPFDFERLEFTMLSKDSYADTNGFYSGKLNFIGYSDYISLHIKKWYKRVLQIPIIIQNGKYYVGLNQPEFKSRVLTYYPNAVILGEEEFIRKFYSVQSTNN